MTATIESPSIKRLINEYFRKIRAVTYSIALLGWDANTYMPKGAAKSRGEILAILDSMIQEIVTSKEFIKLVEKGKEEASNDIERGIIRLFERDIRFYTKVPKHLLEEFNRLKVESRVRWEEAKRKADFKIFAPYLEKLVDYAKKIAEHLGYKYSPYDAWLDQFEEEMTVRDYDPIFNYLRDTLPKEVKRILSSGWPQKHYLEEKPYDRKRMELLNKVILSLIGFDWDHMRLDISAHPFTEGMDSNDVRITTWYHEKDFRRSLFDVIHEFGHALYERQVPEELRQYPVGYPNSLGLHESQSRFWENVIGRSKEFAQLVLPYIRDILGFNVDSDELFYYFNIVRPDTIRVEADEVTYNLHILIRYEIERDLFEDRITISELPSIWNEKMEKYLGIVPKNDAEGVLQDVHWSEGLFGYFPTYTLGNIIAAQIYYKLDNLKEKIAEGNFSEIRQILKEKIHRYGSIYTMKALLKKSFNTELKPELFIKYIKEKFS